MIPLIILAIEDESRREFMIRLYESSVKRMYCEAKKFFSETEDVEDAVSDAVVKLVDKVDLLQQIAAEKRIAYAVTTVRHAAIHILRHESRFQMVSFDALAAFLSDTENVEEKIQNEQRDTQLQTVLSELPPEDRLLLEEKYILLLPDAEIAQTLNIQPNSVRMRLTRAKRCVAKALTDHGFRPEDWL